MLSVYMDRFSFFFFFQRRSKYFLLRVDPIQKGSKNENGRFASPERVPILLKKK